METPKPQRERFRRKHTWKRSRHAEKAKRLADLLREQRRLFPGFAARIDEFIAKVEADAKRTRKSDRERVLQCLSAWAGGLSQKEIMEDTGLSHWDVRQILTQLFAEGKVTKRPERRHGVPPAGWRTIYELKS